MVELFHIGWTLLHFILPLLELLNQLSQGGQLLRVHQVELVNEINKVLEASVQMSLRLQHHDVLEVSVVNVGVHPKQPLEDHLYDIYKVLWEGNP